MKTYTPATGGRYSFITRNQYNRQRKLVSGLKEDKVFQTILNTLQVCESFCDDKQYTSHILFYHY